MHRQLLLGLVQERIEERMFLVKKKKICLQKILLNHVKLQKLESNLRTLIVLLKNIYKFEHSLIQDVVLKIFNTAIRENVMMVIQLK